MRLCNDLLASKNVLPMASFLKYEHKPTYVRTHAVDKLPLFAASCEILKKNARLFACRPQIMSYLSETTF